MHKNITILNLFCLHFIIIFYTFVIFPIELMRHIQDFISLNELNSMKGEYSKNFEELSSWIRQSEEKLSTQQILTGKLYAGKCFL